MLQAFAYLKLLLYLLIISPLYATSLGSRISFCRSIELFTAFLRHYSFYTYTHIFENLCIFAFYRTSNLSSIISHNAMISHLYFVFSIFRYFFISIEKVAKPPVAPTVSLSSPRFTALSNAASKIL